MAKHIYITERSWQNKLDVLRKCSPEPRPLQKWLTQLKLQKDQHSIPFMTYKIIHFYPTSKYLEVHSGSCTRISFQSNHMTPCLISGSLKLYKFVWLLFLPSCQPSNIQKSPNPEVSQITCTIIWYLPACGIYNIYLPNYAGEISAAIFCYAEVLRIIKYIINIRQIVYKCKDC